MSLCLFALKRVSSPDYIEGTALAFVLLPSVVPVPFLLVSPTTLLFLIPILLRILSIERNRRIEGKIMHWLIKLVIKGFRCGWIQVYKIASCPRHAYTCVFFCSHSSLQALLSPFLCLLVFSLYCFPSQASTFHMATSLATSSPRIDPRPKMSIFFLRAQETVPERPWIDPAWPSLMGSPDSFCLLTLFFSASTPQSLSPALPCKTPLCSGHGFSAKKLRRIIFSTGHSESRFIRICPHGSQFQPCSTDAR